MLIVERFIQIKLLSGMILGQLLTPMVLQIGFPSINYMS